MGALFPTREISGKMSNVWLKHPWGQCGLHEEVSMGTASIHPRKPECWEGGTGTAAAKRSSKQIRGIAGFLWLSLPGWREQANNSTAQHVLPQDRAAPHCAGWQRGRT